SDQYPLVYGWTDGSAAPARRADPPDIVVVMVESLRAEALAIVTGRGDSVTPNLDALARRGVVFPTYTSNGFPSAPAVLSFHASAWPHRRKEIITDFVDRGFDSIPSRLRGLGYDTIYVGADPHFDNQALWMPRWYSTAVDLVAGGIAPTDRHIVGRSIDEIRRHDARSAAQPLFEFISTYSTHYPFTLPEDAGEASVPASSGLGAQYRQTLHYTDRELGTLFSFLASRSRSGRTLTIVVGDHSFYSDLRKISGLPDNDNIWTVAIIAGPEALVGPPRRIAGPASHVDMMPTILAIVGDDRPSATLGSNLLGSPRASTRMAVAVRPGGLRCDRDGYAVVVDARTPNRAETRVAFPGLFGPTSPPPADVNAGRLTDWITTWSYLIEHNRVWNDAWLTSSPASPSIGVPKSP
ncbi:MAG: LTA synthase family protein, partial [Acidobacteria bacterium]|nr:LTA synthase family protein [Acidobacteriota bacterium]